METDFICEGANRDNLKIRTFNGKEKKREKDIYFGRSEGMDINFFLKIVLLTDVVNSVAVILFIQLN